MHNNDLEREGCNRSLGLHEQLNKPSSCDAKHVHDKDFERDGCSSSKNTYM